MAKIKTLVWKTVKIIKNDGLGRFFEVFKNYIKLFFIKLFSNKGSIPHTDIIFINGCDYSVPHPIRYRVHHQMEQLLSSNVSCTEVFYRDLTLDYLRYARGFIIFRCPYTDMVGEFIKQAKELNKAVYFDIDDLVIDTKYTDLIKYVREMPSESKSGYDEGVRAMAKTMSMCDGVITTTEHLAQELSNYMPKVFINRNTASEKMAQLSEKALEKREKEKQESKNIPEVTLGYFSGSITHNEDFESILPAIIKVMNENSFTKLLIIGHLDLPEHLKSLSSRVIAKPFGEWEALPQLIASIDINLAPLTDTIFNECKSENKWIEAALVKVPTIASNIGAFAKMVQNHETGVLCSTSDEWYNELTRLVRDGKHRQYIGENAYAFCNKRCRTIYTGSKLAKYIREALSPQMFFVLPSLHISGGTYVSLKHASILKKHGYDIMLLDMHRQFKWYKFENNTFPVLSEDHPIASRIDKCTATMWTTTWFLEKYKSIDRCYYLVQNFETDFYKSNTYERVISNKTYNLPDYVNYITISKWCQKWLGEDYGKSSKYAPNGIDVKRFYPERRDFSGKIRILIEGDCKSYYKNVDESFEITNRLDRNKFEVWYLSYNAMPKAHYKVDKTFNKITYDEVNKIYRKCHILVKSSILESFSYPPIEMMATGGYVVVAPNGGNIEYLEDNQNCLLYPQGDIDSAIHAIESICSDEALRDKLYAGGQRTAQSRDWEKITPDILSLYE